MLRKFSVLHFRLWAKIIFTLIAFSGFLALHNELAKYTVNPVTAHVWRGLFASIVLPLFSIVIWIFTAEFNSEGLTVQIGINLKNDKFLGFKKCKKWKDLEIRLWSTWPNPTIAVHKNKMPAIWWALHTHYQDCLRIIAKYGKDRMMDEETRRYFSKFEGEK